MDIIFKYVGEQCTPMNYKEVDHVLDAICRDLADLGTSGRLRVHNRAMNELGRKTEPINCFGVDIAERRYQALLNARAMLKELNALVQLSLPKEQALSLPKEQALEQKGQEAANNSGKKRKAKFQFSMAEVLSILGGGFLGALLTRILFG